MDIDPLFQDEFGPFPGAEGGSWLPRIVFVGTGGTISGELEPETATDRYVSGKVAVDALLSAVPSLPRYVAAQTEQLSNIGSEDMTDEVWLQLANRLSVLLAASDVDGAVVLHGTDTMEETAYFLNLTLRTSKPVILTGAMRPANAIGADGPGNILAAARLAAHSLSAGKGVMVAFNDEAHAARDVMKMDTVGVAPFASPGVGPLCRLANGMARFTREPTRRHTTRSEFSLAGVKELPWVEIIYGHSGQRRDLIDAAVAAGVKGLVYAGVGMGCVHHDVVPALREAVEKGVMVVLASRVVGGVVPAREKGVEDGLISGDSLSPQKARVLLQLSMTRTLDRGDIQEMFVFY